MMTKTAHPFRRTAVVTLTGMFATLLAWVAPWAGAAENEFVAGSGRAKATIIRVGPSAAQLSLAPSVGVALTDYVNTLGRGETLIFDWAALDTSINDCCGDLKTEFPPLRVESRYEGSEAGVRWEPKPGIVETAQATSAPVGRSSVAIEGFEIPGIVKVTGGKARSFSGVYTLTDDKDNEKFIRAAGGTVDIPRLELFGGAVVMHDLRWEVAQITDENDDDKPEMIGGFQVGRLVAQGETHDSPMNGEQLANFAPLQEGLAQAGLHLEFPELTINDGGVATVTPLRIRLAGLPTARDEFAPLHEGIQQLRNAGKDPEDETSKGLSEQFVEGCQDAEGGGGEEPEEGEGGGESGVPLPRFDYGEAAVHGSHGGDHDEFDEFERNGPSGEEAQPDYAPPAGGGGSDCGLPFLVADLVLAPLTGFGQLDIDLGGAFGVTEGTLFEGFDLFGFESFSETGGGFTITDDTGPDDDDGDDGAQVAGLTAINRDTGLPVPTTPPPSTPPAQSGGNDLTAAPPLELTGSRASAAWAVGLAALAAALSMAGTDYRRLRNRKRMITPIT